jgi:hypothetical protein
VAERRLRILHAPINVAGGPGAISAGLRALGHESTLLVFNERPFVRGYDRNLDLVRGRGVLGLARNLPRQVGAFRWALREFDILHYHFGQSLLPRHVDARIARRRGKGVVHHFWGSDIRDKPAGAVGFLRHADAAIVGSGVVRQISQMAEPSPTTTAAAIEQYCKFLLSNVA